MIYIDLDLEPIDQGEDLWWVFHLESTCTWETCQKLLNEFNIHEVRLLDEQLDNPNNPTTVQAVLRDEQADLYIELFYPSDSPRLYLGVSANKVLPSDSLSARLNADLFLEYGKICYGVLRPLYAFAQNLNTFVDGRDITQNRLTHVCWAQFFGPTFVQNFGSKILRNAPSWRNENLSDEGLLYVLAMSPYLYQCAGQHWQQAREYMAKLGLPSLTWSDLPN